MKKIGKIKNITIVIKQGNIAFENVECIVVPEFKSCSSPKGVGASIKKAGMEEGLKAYDMATKEKPLTDGEEMITPSGIVGVMLAHVATIEANADEQFYIVTKAVLQTLISADALGAKTIAIPALGTGAVGTLTLEQSAKAIFAAVEHFKTVCNENTLQEVRLVINSGSTEPAEKVLDKRSYHNAKPEVGQKEFDLYEWIDEIRERM